jgi:hypothetical protein
MARATTMKIFNEVETKSKGFVHGEIQFNINQFEVCRASRPSYLDTPWSGI